MKRLTWINDVRIGTLNSGDNLVDKTECFVLSRCLRVVQQSTIIQFGWIGLRLWFW